MRVRGAAPDGALDAQYRFLVSLDLCLDGRSKLEGEQVYAVLSY
jgi:hypothetical protein